MTEKNEEDVNDFGKKPTYCHNCRKKTLSKEEISNYRCSECNRLK